MAFLILSFFFFSSRRRHTRYWRDWSSDVCSSDLVLDGVGAGHAPDAADFGDEGANTLGNTARAVGGLEVPNLQGLGLGNVVALEGVPAEPSPRASHGLMVELSAAKATLAGHWEMMGLVLEDPLPTYPDGFPDWIIDRFRKETGRGVIGNRPDRKSTRLNSSHANISYAV